MTTEIIVAVLGCLASIVVAYLNSPAKPAGGTRPFVTRQMAAGFLLGIFATAMIVAFIWLIPDTRIPRGTVVAWYMEDGPTPDGWAICNGNQGTPDLKNRFLRGVGTFAECDRTGTPPKGDTVKPKWPGTSEATTDSTHAVNNATGDPFMAPGTSHRHTAPMPPHWRVVFIMKL